jgi:hypothetical protein
VCITSHLLIIGSLLLCLPCNSLGQNASTRRREGVQATAPVVISFNRVAPLLDGLFEDVTAIQFSPLQLSSVGANAATLDAFQRSFQGAFSANTIDALQNQVNSQYFQSEATYQTSMFSQLSALTQQLATANASVAQETTAQAQAATAAAAAPSDTSLAAQATAATAALTSAQSDQTSLQAQVTALQRVVSTPPTLGTVTTTTPSSTTNAAGGAQNSLTRFLGAGTTSAAPSLPTLSSTPGSGNGSASLPPTQQMDTQIGLLWDRMMRVASTFSEPDSEKDVQYELLRFYPSVTYSDKRTEAIRLTYEASCEAAPDGSSQNSGGHHPTIIDLYPRRSPVNILGEKVRDSSFSVAGFLGFGAANTSASYNQEHLKMTSAMSQSSYITGFGSGLSQFGWLLGKVLGDDTVAVGQRELYALVAVPREGCGTLKVQAVDIAWIKKDGAYLDRLENPNSGPPLEYKTFANETAAAITSLSYAQAQPGSLVPISLTLNQPVDPEMRIIVNGSVLLHTLDNFARGTAIVSGTAPNNTGMFEQQAGAVNSIQAGTWSSVSEKTLVLILDPKVYPDRFPSISMIMPTSSRVDVSYKAITNVSVNGSAYKCEPSCSLGLPGLELPPTSVQSGIASHFEVTAAASAKDLILIRIPSDASVIASSAASVRVLSSGDPSIAPWGPSPRVLAIVGDFTHELEPCSADGLVLICPVWSDYDGKEDAILDVYDQSHSGAALHTQIKLAKAAVGDQTPQLLLHTAANV